MKRRQHTTLRYLALVCIVGIPTFSSFLAVLRITPTAQKEEEQQQQQPWEGPSSTNSQQPLNIVLLYADDWSYKTLGAMGNKYVQTPVLDQLAQRGILFTHNCVVTSVCMQSRATLYTGQYSSRHQTFFSWRDVKMYEHWNQTLYPLMLQHQYHVGFFGKYHHLEPVPPGTFTEYQSYMGSHYMKRGDQVGHVTHFNEQDAIRFLKTRPNNKPFFLTVSFFATHAEDGHEERYFPMNHSKSLYTDSPVPHPPTYTDDHWNRLPPFFDDRNFGRSRFIGRYDTPELYQKMMKNMYRMATEVDAACGRILDELQRQNLQDNTLIIFTTDNGNFHGEHGLAEKWFPYEESLRVPLIVVDPRTPRRLVGTRNDALTLNIDLAPTILSAAGVPVPTRMQGRNMADLYHDDSTDWRQEFLYEFWDDNAFIPNSLALVEKDFKFIYWTDHDYTEAFDLREDPYEEHPRTNPAQRAVLLERIRELQELAKVGVPM